jgi:hypothetical protein
MKKMKCWLAVLLLAAAPAVAAPPTPPTDIDTSTFARP